MLRDDGSKVQVYHVADGLSKGMRVHRNQSSSQDHEHTDLPMTRWNKPGDEAWHRTWHEAAQGTAGAVHGRTWSGAPVP